MATPIHGWLKKKKQSHEKRHESERDKILFERSIKEEKAGLWVCAKTINRAHRHWAFSMAGESHRRKEERFLLIKSDVADPCWERCSGILAGFSRVCGGGMLRVTNCVIFIFFFLVSNGGGGLQVHTWAHTAVIAVSVVPRHLYIFLLGMWNEDMYTRNKNKLNVGKNGGTTSALVTL